MARRFNLIRDVDADTAPGIVGEGVVFAAGPVVVCWVEPMSLSMFDNFAKLMGIYDRYGITRVQWLDRSTEIKASRERGTELLRGAESTVLSLMGDARDQDGDFGDMTLPGVPLREVVHVLTTQAAAAEKS